MLTTRSMVPSAIVLSLVWLGAFLRHPEVLWSLGQHAAQRGRARVWSGLPRTDP